MNIQENLINDLKPRKGNVKPIYRLRWVFRFLNGKTRAGVWNGSTNNFSDSAASINKTGLLVAEIQGECFHGYGIKTFFSCDGHDYITAKWKAATNAGMPIGKWKKDSYTISPDVVGLTFYTRKINACVLVDGRVIIQKNNVNQNIENVREHKTRI